MDSINRNQPEHNRENLHGAEAVKKMQELIHVAQTGFFCTKVSTGQAARPMNVRQTDDAGNLWFLSASDSNLNAQLRANASVSLFFQGSPHSDFLFLEGNASVSTDKAKIKELWEPVLSTWFTAGIDDPRITVIKVVPTDGYYWDTKHGGMIAGIKMFVGAVMGKTLDDSIEGKLQP